MDIKILDWLRCPVSGGRLELETLEAETVGGRQVIKTGILRCGQSRLWYPIISYVPVMLTFQTALVDGFARRHAAQVTAQPGFNPPNLPPETGERAVQKSFTEEWSGLKADPLTFVYTVEQLTLLHREVWLHLPPEGDPTKKRVMDVGCGFGREAQVLEGIFPNADVLGVDLNLSLLEAAPALKGDPRLHLVIASLFKIPFEKGSMDHVHCQGVLHHTYSTKRAFDSIAAFVAPTGSIFTWVYATEDSFVVKGMRGLVIRAYWLVSHRIGRPILSRLPAPLRNACMFLITCLLHPLIKARWRHPTPWKFSNSLHGLRDMFTPRYADQLGFNEVLTWYEELGLTPLMQRPGRYREIMGSRLLGVGMVGRRRAS